LFLAKEFAFKRAAPARKRPGVNGKKAAEKVKEEGP